MRIFRRRAVWGCFLLLFTFLASSSALAHHTQLARTGERWSREELLLRFSLLRREVADLAGLQGGGIAEAADAAVYGLERLWARAAPLLAEKGERDLASELEQGIEALHEAVHVGDEEKIVRAARALLPLLDRAAGVLQQGSFHRFRGNPGFWLFILAVTYVLAATAAAFVFYRSSRRRVDESGVR